VEVLSESFEEPPLSPSPSRSGCRNFAIRSSRSCIASNASSAASMSLCKASTGDRYKLIAAGTKTARWTRTLDAQNEQSLWAGK
jgi:hypothetical protein